MERRWTPRVTVAAVIEQGGRFLLVEEQTQDGLRLNNPAGHLEPGESPAQACVREALEETGHAFEPTALVGVYLARPGGADARGPAGAADPGLTYLRFAFCGELGAADPHRPLDRGIVRTLWMDVGELRASRARHRSPLVLRCVSDYLAGRRHPLDLIHCDPSLWV
ncbi:MAG: Nudix-like NDP and NTP phosphohydrolase NudJ [Burkholderiaceae bacterium]|jgi:8-oxo-dGTP pyrophosphatase MutT (NUDIX family)|nr:MAG: Nudix-like NDP and NTP phosphohydrolase NudJ [Burkholderiaceae bacterium]